MSKKFGLGTGLNALIPEDTILSTLDTKVENASDIKENVSILIDINLITYYIKPLRTFCIFSILMAVFPLKYPNGNLSDGYQIYKILKS